MYFIFHCYISEISVCLQSEPPFHFESQQLKGGVRDSDSQRKANSSNELPMSTRAPPMFAQTRCFEVFFYHTLLSTLDSRAQSFIKYGIF